MKNIMTLISTQKIQIMIHKFTKNPRSLIFSKKVKDLKHQIKKILLLYLFEIQKIKNQQDDNISFNESKNIN